MSMVSVFLRSSSLPFGLRWSVGVGSRFSCSYVCLSLTSESNLSVYSFLSIKTVTRPLSAGSMTMSLSFFSISSDRSVFRCNRVFKSDSVREYKRFAFFLGTGRNIPEPVFVGFVAFFVCGMLKSSQFGLYSSVVLLCSLVTSLVSNSRNSVE